MPYEMLVAMNVHDSAGYGRYRAAMKPILAEYGGAFRHDYVVAQTLATPCEHPVTRIFSIEFPDVAASEAFFADEAYLAVRDEHFVPAVDGYTLLNAPDGTS